MFFHEYKKTLDEVRREVWNHARREAGDKALATELKPTFRRSDELFSANIAATASRSRRREAALSAG